MISRCASVLTAVVMASSLVVAPRVVAAQVRLTLADAVRLALESSHEIAIQRDAEAIAGEAERRARGGYDLLLRADGRGRVRTDPINSILSGAPAGALAPRVSSVGAGVGFSQLFASGATLSASTALSRDTSNSTLASLSPSWLTSVSVDFRQPLLQGREIDATRRAIRLSGVDRSRTAASLARVASDVVAAVERAYWSLVAARRDLEVRHRTLALAERQRDDTKARLDAGVAAETDLAAPLAEIERRRGDLAASEQRVAQAEHRLKALLTPGVDAALWNDAIEPIDLPEASAVPADLGAALREAVSRRPEVAEARAAVDRQAVDIDVARDRLRPQLDLVATYALRGLTGAKNDAAPPIGGALPPVSEDQIGALPDSYATLLTHRFADVSLGLAYTVPLGNHAAKADLAIAELGRRQALATVAQVEQRIGLEVRDAVAALRAATLRLAAARAGRTAAEVQLQAEQDRYDAGLTINFFVLTRQNDLAAAELAEVAALVDCRLALTDYHRAIGSLLDRHAILVAGSAAGEPSR